MQLNGPDRQAWATAGGALSPGELWETAGAKVLLGYGWKAPLDSKGGTEIAHAWASALVAGTDPVDAWREANNRDEGRNAVAIDLRQQPARFSYWTRNKFDRRNQWTSVNKTPQGWGVSP